jgi:hypothetical protein
MRLGIMVTTDALLEQVIGLTRAAVARGHAVAIFATDAGVNLLGDGRFTALSGIAGAAMSYCGQSAETRGGPPPGLPAAIVQGSQFENAVMTAESDKVIVL